MPMILAGQGGGLTKIRRALLIVAYQRDCRHFQRAARLYLALAELEQD